jgi:hypothetical protein
MGIGGGDFGVRSAEAIVERDLARAAAGGHGEPAGKASHFNPDLR